MTSIKVNDEHNMTSIKVIFQCPKIQIWAIYYHFSPFSHQWVPRWC
jgi:hypothetical protein